MASMMVQTNLILFVRLTSTHMLSYIVFILFVRLTSTNVLDCVCLVLFKIHQRGVQWKQGVVIYIMLYTSSLYSTTPIHCTSLPLHPPVMNTQFRGRHPDSPSSCGRHADILCYCYIWINNISLSLYIYMYIYMHIYICIYICIYII